MNQFRQPIAVLLLLLLVSTVQADDLDDFIRDQLRKRHIPGLSLAVIQDGKIVKATTYGFGNKNKTTPLSTATLFQAGSISKSVAAVGALYLTEAGKLSLDEDVNMKLRSWKVPENEFTKDKKVTLRGLLSHTTGLTVHGFPGYEVGKPIPTIPQILNGALPANTAPVRVDFVPGTRWRYSGGGYTVMQQLMLDVTDVPFPTFMADKDRLVTLVDGFADEEFVPETPTRFASIDRDAYLTITPDSTGKVSELVLKQGKDERKIPRIGPLFQSMAPAADPDIARTKRIETALTAIAQGAKAVKETPGPLPILQRQFLNYWASTLYRS